MKHLWKKYQMMSEPAKASFWFVVSNVMMRGISFFTLPVFSRMLSTEQYGVISVFQSLQTILSIICTLTIWGGVFNVAMVKYPDNKDEVISAFQGLSVTVTLIVMVICSFFSDFLSNVFHISKFLFFMVFIQILAQIPFNIWSTKQRYEYKYKKVIFVTLFSAILNPFVGYLMIVNTSYKAEARILSLVLFDVIIGIILFFVNYRKDKFFDLNYWKWGFVFNIVLIPHYLSTQILNQADRLMINDICGESQAGIYNVAYTFSMLIGLVTSGINSSMTPFVYQSLKDGKVEKLRKVVVLVVLSIALLDVAFICFIPDVFRFMLPESYYEAIWVIPPVAVAAFFVFLYPLFGAVEFYFEEKKYITYASCVGAVINIILNQIFIRKYGYVAAAYTTLFCYIGFSLCHYLFMKKILKKNGYEENIYNIKSILIISVCLVTAMVVITVLYNYYLIRLIIFLIITFVGIINRDKIRNMMKELLG